MEDELKKKNGRRPQKIMENNIQQFKKLIDDDLKKMKNEDDLKKKSKSFLDSS